ncbi:MAG: GntR family transcriptional regulator [Steroidobacteraceae bacterium]
MANSSYGFGNPLLARQSSPEVIASSLRQAIIDGQLGPGEALNQENLAKHYSVSRIPVREALRQLGSEGWIVLERNRGARVSPLSADEVREIYEIRASLEVTALRLAAPRHTTASLAQLDAVLRAACSERDHSLYAQHNREFHLALFAPAARPRLVAMIDSLHRQGERYLRLKLDMPAYKHQSDHEHEAILQALRAGKPERAVRILQPHMLRSGELLASHLTRHLARRAAAGSKREPAQPPGA